MRTESVAESFASYRRQVMPAEASDVQVLECQRAFYAGTYHLLMNIAYNIGDDSTDEEQGVLELERLKEECEAFLKVGGVMPDMTPPVSEPASYNVRSTHIEQLLRELGRDLKSRMPKGWGFVLLIASFGPQGLPKEGKEGAVFYLASVERASAIELLREFVKRETH